MIVNMRRINKAYIQLVKENEDLRQQVEHLTMTVDNLLLLMYGDLMVQQIKTPRVCLYNGHKSTMIINPRTVSHL